MQNKPYRTHFIRQLNETLIGQEVRVAGWIEDIRDIGKLVFLVIRDPTGAIQTIVKGNNLRLAKDCPRQSAVVIIGILQISNAKDFLFEISTEELVIVTKAVHPLPIDPTGRISSALDKRIDSRALDLRNPKVAAIFKLRSNALNIIRQTLINSHFIEVNTSKIIGTASEGGANLFAFNYFERKAYLAQSPQLYKEQLILSLDRVFEIGPYFRAEKSHTVRHLSEFTSVDIEAAFIDYKDCMTILEELILNLIKELSKICAEEIESLDKQLTRQYTQTKISRLTYEQCLEELSKEGEKIEFGSDLTDSSLRLLGELHRGFYFIVDWPTGLKPFYIHEKGDQPDQSESFDLQYGYLELASGGSREHDSSKLRSRLIQQGLQPNNFSEHLKVFDWGMPPHSGWGLGFDRLMMILTGSQNVREVVLFPRDVERLTP
jgi:nondiscriminating aspartyl-tRNA synthetase